MNDGQTKTEPKSTETTDNRSRLDESAREDDDVELTFTERDLESEIDDGRTGQRGTLVEAVCTGCKLTRAKRASEINREDPDLSTSFRHVCHNCGSVQYFNPIRLLEDALADNGGRSE